MPFAPAVAIDLAPATAKARPAITSRVTQAAGESAAKTVSVEFPVGFAYNELLTVPRCTAPQEADAACPDASKLGTVDAISPLSPASGNVYLTSDFRLVSFVTAAGGLLKFRVIGTIGAAPTGAFTVVFSGLPNLALTSLTLKLEGGPLALVKNPATCGDYRFSVRFTSYDGDETLAEPSVPIGGCVARVALSALRVSPSRPKAGKPVTLRWKATAATEATKVVLLRAGRPVRRRTVAGTSLRFASLRPGRYVAKLRATGAGRTSAARRLAFTVAR